MTFELLLSLFAVRAAFPNMFLALFHEAVMRNMIEKGGVAGGMRWWGCRHRGGWVPWGPGLAGAANNRGVLFM